MARGLPQDLTTAWVLCSFEPIANACDFSASPSRPWYFYHEDADCKVSESIAKHQQHLIIKRIYPLEWNSASIPYTGA